MAKRSYKDSLFQMIFCTPGHLMKLYNVVNECIREGLRALVSTMKRFLTDADEVYTEVIKYSQYTDLPEEEFKKIYNEL